VIVAFPVKVRILYPPVTVIEGAEPVVELGLGKVSG
jgi:hypothetical protein